MAPNSSTSSSNRLARALLFSLGFLALAWVAYALLTPWLPSWLGTRFGPQILSLGKGRILEPVEFVAGRAADLIWLLTVFVVLVNVGWLAQQLVLRRVRRTWAWLPVSTLWLVVLNLFLGVAGNTVLWWMVLYGAYPNLQQPAFHMERLLLEESPAPTRIVIVGSSQGGSEIHTGELSRYGSPSARAANLSYAGATASDFILIREHYRQIDPQVVIVYLSPLNLYTGVTGSRWLPLLTGNSFAYFLDTEVWALGETPRLLQGVLGLAIPMFRQRTALQHAVFGAISVRGYVRPADLPVASVADEPGDPRPSLTTGDALRREAATFEAGTPSAKFLKQELQDYLLQEASEGRTVVIIDGQVNPVLAAAIDPSVFADYEPFVERLSRLDPRVTVLRNELPRHSPGEYVDLYHITGEQRSVFTRELAAVLAGRFGLPTAAGSR